MKKHLFILTLFIFSSMILAYGQNVSGKVTDETGEPLPGASLVVKGTKKGTISDLNGNFTIGLSQNEKVLIVSFIGYVSQEIDVMGKSNLTVKLLPETVNLEEVVAVGYGTQKKANLIGAVENISVKEIENRPLTNSSMALQGQVAGVDVIQGSGEPGDDQGNIRIRGVSSIENNNEPLVLIDGIEGDINQVNPKDIESMSVLKDASSAAIYGNRAAAGVIIITTKGGTEGSMKVSYTNNFGLQQATQLPTPVDIFTWIDLKQEMLTYNGQKTQADALETERAKFQSGEKTAVNYYDIFFRNAMQQDHYLSFSGGSKFFKGSASVGYTDQDGVLLGTGYKKYSFRTNTEAFSANRKVNFKFNLSGFRGQRDEYAVSSNTVINNIHRAGPVSVFQATNGLYGYYGMYYAQKELGGGTNTFNNALNGRTSLSIDLFKGFQVSAAFGFYYGSNNISTFAPPLYTASDLYGDSKSKQKSYYQVQDINSLSNTLELITKYNNTFNKIHKVSALLGYSQMSYDYDMEFARRENYEVYVPSLNMGDPATQINSDSHSQRATRAVFGRFGYTLKDRYLFELNSRLDGSSRFNKNKYGFFPSVSAGWRVSEENFFRNAELRFVDNLKIRTSWGQLGNEAIYTSYTGFDMMDYKSPYTFGGLVVSGASVTELSNSLTTWETTEQTNIGIDLGILRNLSFSIDGFYKLTSNILMKVPIPISLGIPSTPYQNAGVMENKGLEFTAKYQKNFSKDFKFNTSLAVSHIQNKILDLDGKGPILHPTSDNATPVLISMEGQPYGSFYGYRTEGIFQVTDFTWQNNSDASIPVQDRTYTLKAGIPTQSENPQPGDLRFKDISGPDGTPDGVIDLNYDRVIIGKQFPDLTYSLSVGGEYKGFDLNLFFYGVLGRDAYNQGAMVVPFVNDNGNVWSELVADRWTYENPSTTRTRLFNDNTRLTMRSDYYIEDASFVRLKNIELGYSIPGFIVRKLKMEKIRFYAGVQNAFTFTAFKGWDPERPADNITSDIYPQVRVYNIGLNVNF